MAEACGATLGIHSKLKLINLCLPQSPGLLIEVANTLEPGPAFSGFTLSRVLFLRKFSEKVTLQKKSQSKKRLQFDSAFIVLTLNAPITIKVVCFSRLLKCLRSLYGEQCRPRSDCSYRSSLFWVHTVFFYT